LATIRLGTEFDAHVAKIFVKLSSREDHGNGTARWERGMPGEFDWLDKLSVDELRLLADGKLDIASYWKEEDADGSRRCRPN
jgi:hypothetical protein